MTSYWPPTRGGKVRKVSRGSNLQAIFNRVRPGETIELPAGATFRGNFKLPRKKGDGWIYIRSSAHAKLPPPGTRVRPAEDAHLMPKIKAVGTSPGRAIEFQFGAHHYRFVGIEITTEHNHRQANVSNLVTMGWEGGTEAEKRDQLPHHIIFDRCYLHGTSEGNVRRGILLNGNHVAVIDSHLSDFHETGPDSQALMATNGEGPFKIVNNYLEGAGENVMFGGMDPQIDQLVPADIEIRGNHFTKPWSWKTGHATYQGIRWTVKNLLELKNARQVLVDGNLFENCWQQAQQGSAILVSVRNQGGTAPWSVVEDVTFSRNVIRHASSGLRITGCDSSQPSRQTSRVAVRHNMLVDINRQAYGGRGVFFQVVTERGRQPVKDLTIENNTAIHGGVGGGILTAQGSAPAVRGFTFRNNVVTHGQYGIKGDGQAIGSRTLLSYLPRSCVIGNVLIGRTGNNPASYPRGNFRVATIEEIGFADLEKADFRLAGSSRFAGRGVNVGQTMNLAEKARQGVRNTVVRGE